MSPTEIFDLTMNAIQEWNKGDRTGEGPSVLLVVPRKSLPSGQTIALFGRRGPRGRIATIKETASGYDVVAYFQAVHILNSLAEAMGMKTPIVQRVKANPVTD